MKDALFELMERNAQGHITSIVYKVQRPIDYSGNLDWLIIVPQLNVTSDQKEIHRSQWMESLRKDVGCTFGILKGHWRKLKTCIQLHGVEVADEIWMTYCALHNWLLKLMGWILNGMAP